MRLLRTVVLGGDGTFSRSLGIDTSRDEASHRIFNEARHFTFARRTKTNKCRTCAPLHQYSLNTPKSRVGIHLRLTCFVSNLLSVTKGPEQEGMGKKHMTAMCFLCVSLLDELLVAQKNNSHRGFSLAKQWRPSWCVGPCYSHRLPGFQNAMRVCRGQYQSLCLSEIFPTPTRTELTALGCFAGGRPEREVILGRENRRSFRPLVRGTIGFLELMVTRLESFRIGPGELVLALSGGFFAFLSHI